MKGKTDLRIIKTRTALFDAFLILLREKQFEDITVNEICEKAMVRRATFYKHFADKYDFLAAYMRDLSLQFHESIQQKMESGEVLYGTSLPEIPEDQMILPLKYFCASSDLLLDFLRKNKQIIRNVTNGSAFYLVLEILAEEISHSILMDIREYQKSGQELPCSAEMIASFLSGGLIQTIREWVKLPSLDTDIPLEKEIHHLFSSLQIKTAVN